MTTRPLCVDLDGTLIHSDLLLESFLLLIKRNPLYLFLVPLWLLGGKAALKAEIARRVELNPAALPYHRDFLDWLGLQRDTGRSIWLCTASNYRLAEAVARHVGFFDGVLASSDSHNLSGRKKAAALAERFGEGGFDYCGNHAVDLPVWQTGGGAVMVNGAGGLAERAGAVAELHLVFPARGGYLHALRRALRLHQWAKNALVFIPLLAAHKAAAPALVMAALAFLAFGLCASSVYVLNDMLDLEADRQHPRKSRRPFAAGDLSLLTGLALVPALLLAALGVALLLPDRFLLVLSAYYLLTVAYSFILKRLAVVDTLALAALYTVRIVAGAAAVGVPLSFWLLSFSMFLFLSLALVKRYAELDAMQRDGKLKAAGRGYHVEDLPVLNSLGTASGYMSVLVLALYINTPDVAAMYHHPQGIWLLCVMLLYWISSVWLKTHRGEMHDDPLVFALSDRTSLAIGAACALTVLLSS